ncbi:hypothetical protein D3C87_1434010 [compost metagenome]
MYSFGRRHHSRGSARVLPNLWGRASWPRLSLRRMQEDLVRPSQTRECPGSRRRSRCRSGSHCVGVSKAAIQGRRLESAGARSHKRHSGCTWRSLSQAGLAHGVWRGRADGEYWRNGLQMGHLVVLADHSERIRVLYRLCPDSKGICPVCGSDQLRGRSGGAGLSHHDRWRLSGM